MKRHLRRLGLKVNAEDRRFDDANQFTETLDTFDCCFVGGLDIEVQYDSMTISSDLVEVRDRHKAEHMTYCPPSWSYADLSTTPQIVAILA